MHDDSALTARSHLAPDDANPVLVEVTRGRMVESQHRGSAVVVDTGGKVVARWGDHTKPVYPRSATKFLQAIPLVESGAADAFGLGDREVALACASHNAEAVHTDTVTAWLAKIGLSAADLECGAAPPKLEETVRAMTLAGQSPSALHNNCSGKHAGFLTTAVHKGESTTGYVKFEHPVQQRVLGVLEAMCGIDLGSAPRGTDGCSIPVIAVPLENMAYAMARFGAPDDLPEARATACRRIADAIAAEPYMVAGKDRYCTALMEITGRAVLAKTGAEGVFCAALPDHGLGIALKCDDGAARASEIMMTAVLSHLGVLGDAMNEKLAVMETRQLINPGSIHVGDVMPTRPFAR